MNLLSVLSIIIYTSFFIGACHMLTAERKSTLNRSASAVLISLAWWSLCNSFFFAATTIEQAWFWHRLSSIGWCGFVVLTAYYFVVLTRYKKKSRMWWEKLFFFTPAMILICKNLFGRTTSLAQNIVQSTSGWGWTYENSVTSPWLWIYLLYVGSYFSLAFYLLYQWAKSVKHKLKQEMAVLFILLDTITILCGVITDVILPLTNPILPALASIATAIFGIGYFTIIYKYDLFNINLVISSDDILQTSNNAIFVMDENKEILKYNQAAGELLGYNKNKLMGVDFMDLIVEEIDFRPLYMGASVMDLDAKLCCRNGMVKDVWLSASVAKDKHNSFLCMIVSCQDISKQKRMQKELELERENYKKLADDYQKLAYYDPLTGLPNRRYFLDMLHKFEERYHMEHKDFAVIFLDLDNFKYANDLYGHNGGDELLITAAEKLQSCLGSEEFVARLGGDEFVVLMPYAESACVVDKMQKIQEEFHHSFSFAGEMYEIKISAGHAIFSQIGDITKLIQIADEAMYHNKKRIA